jgi:hypothetical protein
LLIVRLMNAQQTFGSLCAGTRRSAGQSADVE